MLLTLFARREPSTDETLIKYAPHAKRRDVVVYRDAGATDRVVRIPWFYKSAPTRRRRTIMHNCFRYRLEWLADLPARPVGEVRA